MAINKFMLAVLKALSYPELDLKHNYKLDRAFNALTHPPLVNPYKMWDYQLTVDGRPLPVRIFTPETAARDDILLFFHGGGWVTGTIDSYSATCANLAEHTGRRVLAVDYRLAPEHPFPAAVEDCYGAAQALFTGQALPGLEPGGITLIGDSAGGNLAAAVSLMARDRGEFKVDRQVLIYPATYNDHTDRSPFPSVRENGRDYLLTSKRITEYMELYLQDSGGENSPYFAPLLAGDLSNQPDTLVITAEFDPLRDEGEAYARGLRDAGARVVIRRIPDALHGFFSLPIKFDKVRACYELVRTFLEGEALCDEG